MVALSLVMSLAKIVLVVVLTCVHWATRYSVLNGLQFRAGLVHTCYTYSALRVNAERWWQAKIAIAVT
jgi:hypothetical protein